MCIRDSTYIIDQKLNADGERLGTYGIIKGASTFLGVSIPDTKLAPLAAGYEFENLILLATHMGLGTVWLAATFNRESFALSLIHISPLWDAVRYKVDQAHQKGQFIRCV